MLKYFFESEAPVLLKISHKSPMAGKKKKFGFINIQHVKLEYKKNYHK